MSLPSAQLKHGIRTMEERVLCSGLVKSADRRVGFVLLLGQSLCAGRVGFVLLLFPDCSPVFPDSSCSSQTPHL
ncbi:hypothetical protein PanWU01x14_039580 [Parasponia andersonii]|uniref:Uncharacterized protein n=1 Tax=Parasponia andersonii TaxID=3476 RepID=A0A2P5DQY9_PARAD|nr:hypothetical protein PanWU01x14_039580 [Parasponia andersonii]